VRSSKERKSLPVITLCKTGSAGRIRHDERGAAVWDWSIETGVFDTLSASAVLRRLDVANLEMQDAPALAVVGRDAGGGGDPYNSRGVVPLRTRYR